jgi:hypothetical protein
MDGWIAREVLAFGNILQEVIYQIRFEIGFGRLFLWRCCSVNKFIVAIVIVSQSVDKRNNL